MLVSTLLFYILAFLVLFCAYQTIISAKPVWAAAFLAATLGSLSFLFFNLDSVFVGLLQLILFAGAILTLFVLAIGEMDLKTEAKLFSGGFFSGFFKVASSGFLAGVLIVGVIMSTDMLDLSGKGSLGSSSGFAFSDVMALIWSRHLFFIATLGILLFLATTGARVVLRKAGGALHADD